MSDEFMSPDSIPENGGYVKDSIERLWRYHAARFSGQDCLFDDHRRPNPPVFRADEAHHNVLLRSGAGQVEKERIWAAIPAGKRHKWFRSMRSSQALAQSVFANLKEMGKLSLLATLTDEDGQSVFLAPGESRCDVELERKVDYLGEHRSTSVDAFFFGAQRVAVECKLFETEVGSCSRPALKPNDANYARDRCDGTYTKQCGRADRCSLSESGVSYWSYVPQLFALEKDSDHDPCPLRRTYQLVRNVLAACVREDGIVDANSGHAVLLYDSRNLAFEEGGAGRTAYINVRAALRDRSLLRLCTWQQVTAALRIDPDTLWLAAELEDKYGL